MALTYQRSILQRQTEAPQQYCEVGEDKVEAEGDEEVKGANWHQSLIELELEVHFHPFSDETKLQ